MADRVLLAQCLCPQRHCILAAAEETDDAQTLAAQLRDAVTDFLKEPGINPWCGLCGAKADTWRVEVRRSIYKTMAEAEPELRKHEAMQQESAALLKRLGMAFDKE